MSGPCDLLIIGAGINGAGIAREAAGRGLSVVLCDAGDIGGATSWTSSKLIHGGLRYLEHYAFGLVAESLGEREVMLRIAPHLTRALRFWLPIAPGMRPRWMIAGGLALYDALASLRGRSLPGFESLDLSDDANGSLFVPGIRHAFAYSDVAVDDARLTLANARAAAVAGAVVLPRTRCLGARRGADAWEVELENATGRSRMRARAVVNAAGPWAAAMATSLPGSVPRVRLVRGSHIVVPRLYPGDHACTLQGGDGRVVFVLPFHCNGSLIGTTEVEVDAPEGNHAVSAQEIEYLCRAVGKHLRHAPALNDVLWSFSGVRPLIEDGKASVSAASREYRITVEAEQGLPLATVVGGKLTTYRRLAAKVVDRLSPWLPGRSAFDSRRQPLPGGDLGSMIWGAWLEQLRRAYPMLPATWLHGLAARHGSECAVVLDGVRERTDLGRDFGGGLSEREVEHCIRHEWAATAEDILWRRTKCGLAMTPAQRGEFEAWFARRKP